MTEDKYQEYLNKFRNAKTIETLDFQADKADARNPQDHKHINDAWNTRFMEIKQEQQPG